MRHRKRKGHLNRTTGWRKSTLSHIVMGLFKNERVRVTSTRAKEARRMAESLITLGKKGDSVAAQREAFGVLQDRTLVKLLFHDIAPRFATRAGGYTRIIRLAQPRKGDGASMVYLELTEKAPVEKTVAKKGRSTKKATGETESKAPKSAEKKTATPGKTKRVKAEQAEDVAQGSAAEEQVKSDIASGVKKKKVTKKSAPETSSDDPTFFGGLRNLLKKQK